MISTKRSIAVAVMVCLLATGCTSSQLRQASVAVRNFAVALRAVQDSITVAHQSGFVADADYRSIQAVIGDVAVAGSEATAAIRTAKSKPNALAALDKALISIDRLLDEGVLHVKNDQAKQGLTALILALRGTVTTAQAFLQ